MKTRHPEDARLPGVRIEQPFSYHAGQTPCRRLGLNLPQHSLRQRRLEQIVRQREPQQHHAPPPPLGCAVHHRIPIHGRARFDNPRHIRKPLQPVPHVLGAVRAEHQQQILGAQRVELAVP